MKQKSRRLPREYLMHILEESEFLLSSSNGISAEEFFASPVLKRAFVRSLEIIGEAAKNIPFPVRKEYNDIDWQGMARMRDKLIHHYFGVDYVIVWDVVSNEIPSLYDKIINIVKEFDVEIDKS